MAVSTYTSLGVGYALSNKVLGSKTIEVFVPSIDTTASGDLTPEVEDVEYDITDEHGNKSSGKITSQRGVTAEWLSFNGWLSEPPSIRRGERVEVFTSGQTGKYWWRELGMDRDLRKLDTVLFSISNTRDPEEEFLTAENTYWIEFSTRNKSIVMHTNKNDEEPFAYELAFDTLEGLFHIADDSGNEITLDSNERRWGIRNAEGTYVRIEKNEVEIETVEKAHAFLHGPDITLNNADQSTYSMIGDTITLASPAGGKIVIDSNVTIENSTGSKVALTDGDIDLDSSGGSSLNLAGGNVDTSGGSVSISGDSSVDIEGGGGKINVSGGMVNSN